MHGGLLMLGGARMAKSAGNFFRVSELEEQGFDPLAFRYMALQAKYRTKLDFSTGGLAGADRALTQLRERVAEWSSTPRATESDDAEAGRYEARFRAVLADDLDLPSAMALVAELVHSGVAPADRAGLLRSWDRVLGLDLDRKPLDQTLPEGASALLEAREKARAVKDFETSDDLRDQLSALGVAVIDTAEGQRWKTTQNPRRP
jgi:cysteinyl-tRNA synthetase